MSTCVADYGGCPDQRCANGGRCGMRGSDDYFCTCDRTDGYFGDYCETRQVDLTPLLIVPIVVGILLVLLAVVWICIGVLKSSAAPQVGVCKDAYTYAERSGTWRVPRRSTHGQRQQFQHGYFGFC